MQTQDPIQLSLFDYTFQEADQRKSIDEHPSEGDLVGFEKEFQADCPNDIFELDGCNKEEKQSVEKEGEIISKFDGIGCIGDLLRMYIFGTESENISAWSEGTDSCQIWRRFCVGGF